MNNLLKQMFLVLAIGVLLCGCKKQQDTPAPAPPAATAIDQAKPDTPATGTMQTTCPVMGNKINKDIYVDHQGTRVYFC